MSPVCYQGIVDVQFNGNHLCGHASINAWVRAT
jgi:hypothetical protein